MELKSNSKITILIGGSLSQDDYSTLSLLYLPIIGAKAFSIYLSMTSTLARRNNKVVVEHSLMTDMFNISLKAFVQERKKLEAIGLMNTFFKDDEYVYLLKTPLSPRQFLNDGVLGIYLLDAVGKDLFDQIVKLFKIEKFSKDGYTNITELFDNVYKKLDDTQVDKTEGYLIDKKINSSINKGDFDFDYEEFLSMISLPQQEKEKLPVRFEELIIDTAYSYNLTEADMQKAYYRSLTNDEFSITKLLKEAKQIKRLKETPKSEDNMLDRLKQVDATTILKLLQKNAKASDYQVINRVVSESPFDSAITNLIIFHTLNKNNCECPKYEYFIKVIETFTNCNIDTFEKGVEFVTAQGNYDKEEAIKNKEVNETTNKKDGNEATGSDWLDNFNKQFK